MNSIWRIEMVKRVEKLKSIEGKGDKSTRGLGYRCPSGTQPGAGCRKEGRC